MVITNAYIYPVEGDPIPQGYLRFSDIIEEMGPMADFSPTAGEETFDAEGAWLLPGLVDIHTHLGLFGDGVGFEAEDCNEVGDPITPQLRAVDGINPMDPTFRESLQSGVTAVAVAPGSANPIGGQITAIHTSGRRIDDMVIRAPLAMKFALGENPKSCYHDRDETPVTRMATAALIRQALFEAQAYGRKKQAAEENPELDPPDFDMKHEALLPVLRGEIQAHFHAHRLDDVFTAIRIAKEFSLNYVIVHGTESYLAADLMAAEGARVVTGPNLLDRCKPELKNMTFGGPAELRKAGVLCSICTDHPETPLKYLTICAAVAQKSGLSHEDAIRAITIYPARIAELDDRIGSLRPGKWADLALFTRDPLELSSECKAVFIQGRRCV
ncbi:MAG: amidohydrolase [Oscillospiraceae bacterium]|nr:amidohydrolase [Oscillospiraceae bacterium]